MGSVSWQNFRMGDRVMILGEAPKPTRFGNISQTRADAVRGTIYLVAMDNGYIDEFAPYQLVGEPFCWR